MLTFLLAFDCKKRGHPKNLKKIYIMVVGLQHKRSVKHETIRPIAKDATSMIWEPIWPH